MKQRTIQFFALLLALSAVFSSPALAASKGSDIVPHASYYLSSYDASCTSSGKTISIHYDVTATGTMSNVGAISAFLYESSNGTNFTCVRSYYAAIEGNMLKQNAAFYGKTLTYSGTVGRYYYAIVNIYADNSSGSDVRAFTTRTIQA